MNFEKKDLILFILIIIIRMTVFSQTDIKISNEIRIINGKEYYIHIIEKGHTMYSIARVYEISIDKILLLNPDAKDRLLLGQELKIPIASRKKSDDNKPNPTVSDSLKHNSIRPKPIQAQKKRDVEGLNTTPKLSQQKAGVHIVKAGETLYRIALSHQLNIEKLKEVNSGLTEQLYIGQRIRIPNKQAGLLFNNQKEVQRLNDVKISSNVKDISNAKNDNSKVSQTQSGSRDIVKITEQELPPPQADEHIVKVGENLYRLAIKYWVSVDNIKALNPGITDRIYVGERIKIPQKKRENVLTKSKAGVRKRLSRKVKTDKIEVRRIDEKVKELMPGSSSNIVLMLVNGKESVKEFKLKITVPKSWSLLTDYSSVMLAKKSEQIKVLSFYVPVTTQVGSDEIIVEAFNITDNETIGKLNIPVYVKPTYGLEIKTLETADYVFSGDSLNVNFIIRNLSNTEVKVKGISVFEALILNNTYTIASDSFINITVPILTTKGVSYFSRKNVNFTASIVDHPESLVAKSHAFDVIPVNKVKFDAFNRIPIRISGLYVSDNSMGEKRSGYMMDVSIKGQISEKKKKFIDLHLRAPSNSGNPLFGLSEEYYAKYTSDRMSIVVGDNNFRLSDLTESARYGRGIDLKYSAKKLMLGVFYNSPKYYPDLKNIYSVYTSFYPSEKIKINAGYLNKTFVNDSIASLITISASLNTLKWANIDFEYATGKTAAKSSTAYKASIRINKLKYRSYLNYTWADIDFPGYISNSRYLSTGLSTSLIPKSNFSINYEFNHSNLALDTLYSNAPLSSNLSFSGIFRIKKVNSLGFSIHMRNREDRMEPKLFNYKELSSRITLQSKIKRFEINFYGEFGKIDNLLEPKEGELTNVIKSYFSVLYKLNNNVSLDAFVNYQGGEYFQKEGDKSVFYGATINARIKKKLDLLIEYQSDFAMEEYNKNRSLLSSRISYTLNKNHQLGFSANYNLVKNTLNQKDLSIVFNYNYIINAPVSKKKNIGSLKGKVINNGIDKVEGIEFSLAGNKALTDKDGRFEFPVVKIGSYFLLMDDSGTGLNTIAESAGPYKVEILPGRATDFTISLTKSARIKGAIVIQEDVIKDTKAYVAIKEKLGNLIIEVSKGNELYRQFTDKNGAFSFDDLRTGVWEFKVYESGIASGYQLLTKKLQVELSSGQLKNIDVFLKKKIRKIQFQKSYLN